MQRKQKLVAVKTFSGDWGQKKFQKQKDRLKEILIEKGFEDQITDKWESYRYNNWTVIPILRTNEVAIELKTIEEVKKEKEKKEKSKIRVEKARQNVADAQDESDKPESKVWEKEDLTNQKEGEEVAATVKGPERFIAMDEEDHYMNKLDDRDEANNDAMTE